MVIRTVNGLSLCSGYDGFGLGLSLVISEYRTVCHVEREAYAAAILAARMEGGTLHQAPIWSDLTTFDGSACHGKIHIITAGFPCQPWSCAGKQKGTDDERWLWPSIAEIIRVVQPRIVFLENVPGLLAGGHGHVLGSLATLRYNAEWDCFRASDVGAPHERARLFILAYLHSDGRSAEWFGRILDGFGATLRDNADRCSEDVGDVSSERCGPRAGVSVTAPEAVARAANRGLYPPGRDIRGWRDVEVENQPAISRMANGCTDWHERVRTTGAGLVPELAALAFITLAERIGRN